VHLQLSPINHGKIFSRPGVHLHPLHPPATPIPRYAYLLVDPAGGLPLLRPSFFLLLVPITELLKTPNRQCVQRKQQLVYALYRGGRFANVLNKVLFEVGRNTDHASLRVSTEMLCIEYADT